MNGGGNPASKYMTFLEKEEELKGKRRQIREEWKKEREESVSVCV